MYIADLHIHSRFSRATSRDCDLPHLDWWARRKGIQLIGTGDFTHPAWRAEMREQLVPAGEGVYALREGLTMEGTAPGAAPRFVVTGEISCQPGSGGRTVRPAGGHRQHPLGRPPHSGAGQPGSAGVDPGDLPRGRIHPRPYLDAPLCHVRCLLRL